MYTSLSIKNFRAFQSLEIAGLKRVNLFAGKNNSGKTSVLEAVYLLEGEHVTGRAQRLFDFRGLGKAGFTNYTPRTMPWATLFRELNVNEDIHLMGRRQAGDVVDVVLTTTLTQHIRNFLITQGARQIEQESRAALIARREHFADKFDAIWVLGGAVQNEPQRPENAQEPSYLISGSKRSQIGLAQYLDGLEISKSTGPLLDALRKVDQRLVGLKTNISAGPSLIYVDLGGSTLLPLAVVGDGMLRLFEIVSAMLENRDKILLIDEIENGFHYSVLPSVWALVHNLAKEYNVQVFAVTHSHECAAAAHYAAQQGDGYDYQYFRIDRNASIGKAVAYPEELMQTAIEAEIEYR